MLKNITNISRLAAATVSLIAIWSAVAQGAPVGQTPDNLGWTQPAARDALTSKGSSFLAGGSGTFVSQEAMRTTGTKAQARDATPDAKPDLGSQFDYVFGGVPSPEVTLAGGQTLYSACEVHNCLGNRAFLVVDSAGQAVQSAGFLSVACAAGDYFLKTGKKPPASCDTVPTLTIFYPSKNARNPALSLEIVKWARNEVSTSKQSDRLKIREQFVH